MKKNLTVAIIAIIALVLMDQMSKIFIYNHLLNERFVIVFPFLEFNPKFNNTGPFWFQQMGINLPHFFYCLIRILIFSFVLIYYIRNVHKYGNMMFNLIFILIEAGAICSLSGYVFWEEGCLDFIYLKPFFTFDLKDVYATVAFVLFLVWYYKTCNNKGNNETSST
jgi:lipoprotein signal peptidase